MTATQDREVATPPRPPARDGRALRIGVGIVGVALLVGAPYVLDSYWIFFAQTLAVNFIGAAALNVLTGNTGQFSLGNAAFLAIGAYSGAFLWAQLELPFVVVLVGVAVVGAVAGTVVGLPALRLRGVYLLMSTLAAHFIVVYAVTKYQDAQFGLSGAQLPAFDLGPLSQGSEIDLYFLVVVAAGLTWLLFRNLMRGSWGRATAAVRNRDAAAAACGVPVGRTKLVIWATTSSVVSVAGLLQAAVLGTASSDFYSLDLAISFVAMAIVGGLGTIGGSLVGALFVTVTPEVIERLADASGGSDPLSGGLLSHPFELQGITYGVAIVVFVLLAPDGIAGVLGRAWWAARRRLGKGVRHDGTG